MQILQNVDMLELQFSPYDREVKFITDKLRNKKIQAIYVCGVPNLGPIFYPPKPNPNLSPEELKNISLYLNIYDVNGQLIVKELSTDNLFIDYTNESYINWNINRLIDFEKSSFFYRSVADITRKAKIRIFIAYQTQNFATFNDEISGSKTIFFDKNDSFSMLDQFVGYSLRDKKIKKIHTNFHGGLFLKGMDGRNLDLISELFFKSDSPKEFYLDPIEIDFEKSQIRDETYFTVPNFTRTITFYY